MISLGDRSSYHNPIFISFDPAGDHRRYKDNTFRCEASWALHADYRKVIKTTRQKRPRHGDAWRVVQGKPTRCQNTLQRWVRKTVNSMAEIVKQKTKKLAKGQQQDGPTDVAGIYKTPSKGVACNYGAGGFKMETKSERELA